MLGGKIEYIRLLLGSLRHRHTSKRPCIDCKKRTMQGFCMKEYIEERAIEIAYYIIEHKATVRQTARQFGVSKSTIHKDVTKKNDTYGE